jgi:hypothetical protein
VIETTTLRGDSPVIARAADAEARREAGIAVARFTAEFTDLLRDLADGSLSPAQLAAMKASFADMAEIVKDLRAVGRDEDAALIDALLT